MTANQKSTFAACIAFCLLLGFVWFHLWAMGHREQIPQPELVTFVVTASGLVAAVVAMSFGEKVQAADAEAAPPTTEAKRVMSAIGSLFTARQFWSLETMTTLYVTFYFLTGIAALVMTLIHGSTGVHEVTKNHGLSCSGLILAIARSFFSVK
jgi:hypothetical protein